MKMHEKFIHIISRRQVNRNTLFFCAGYVALVLLIFYCYYLYAFKALPVQKQRNTSSAFSQEMNIELIPSFHLFGLNNDSSLRKMKDSHIELVGIIFKGDASKAILLINSNEKIVTVGDKIENFYTIQSIEPSRVIIATQNGLEELGLFDTINRQPSNTNAIAENSTPTPEQVSQQTQPIEQPQVDNSDILKPNNFEPKTGPLHGNF